MERLLRLQLAAAGGVSEVYQRQAGQGRALQEPGKVIPGVQDGEVYNSLHFFICVQFRACSSKCTPDELTYQQLKYGNEQCNSSLGQLQREAVMSGI